MDRSDRRILIVDDDINMAKTVLDVLGTQGYLGVTARDGHQALALAEEYPLYCVLSDIKMPGMDGVQLFHGLQETHPDFPIMLMTAYVPGELLSRSVDQGVVAVLHKPLNFKLLFMYLQALE